MLFSRSTVSTATSHQMNSRILKPELQANVSEQQQQNQPTFSRKPAARCDQAKTENVPRARPAKEPQPSPGAQDTVPDGNSKMRPVCGEPGALRAFLTLSLHWLRTERRVAGLRGPPELSQTDQTPTFSFHRRWRLKPLRQAPMRRLVGRTKTLDGMKNCLQV